VARVVARAVGLGVLDEQPATPVLPRLLWRAISPTDFRSGLGTVTQGLVEAADAETLRGLIALEAGEVDRARDAFTTALKFSPGGRADGGLDFPGRPIARDGLSWVETPASGPPDNGVK